jgi:hypothetical protein
LAIVLYAVLSGGTSGATTPQAAVRTLLDAGKHGDVGKARSVLCSADRALGALSHMPGSGRITDYTVGAVSAQNGVTLVQASFTTSTSPERQSETFPVVKEGGSWKVCFTRTPVGSSAGLPSGFPTGFPSNVPSAGSPSGGGSANPTLPVPSGGPALPNLPSGIGTLPAIASLCQGAESGFGAASTYMGAAEIGVPAVAQACVWHNSVPEAVTRSLFGKLWAPTTTDENAVVIEFASTDGTARVRITTAREPDGHYYVTGVATS